MSPDDARKLLSDLVKKFDKDGDGKFNYAGKKYTGAEDGSESITLIQKQLFRVLVYLQTVSFHQNIINELKFHPYFYPIPKQITMAMGGENNGYLRKLSRCIMLSI